MAYQINLKDTFKEILVSMLSSEEVVRSYGAECVNH